MNNTKIKEHSLAGFLGLDTAGTYGILLSIYWTAQNVVYFFRGLFSRMFGTEIAEFFIPTLYICFGLLSLSWITKRIRWYDVLAFVLILVYFFANYKLFPPNVEFLDKVKPQFVYYSLPALFVGLALEYDRCERILYVTSIVAVLLSFFSTLTGGGDMGMSVEGEDQARAYSVLAPTLIIVLNFLKHRTPINSIMVFIGVLYMFGLGARGPLVCLAVFIILYYIIFKQYKHPVLGRIAMSLLLVVVLLFFNPLLSILSDVAEGMGLSTRIRDYSSMGVLTDGVGRDIIAANVFEGALNGPLFGGGFCADRLYSNFYNTDTYAHNIALELWAEFGMYLGSVFIVFILMIFIKAIRKAKNENESIFVLIMFVSGVCSLLFSGTYLCKDLFFIALGLFISLARRRYIVIK